MAALLGMRDSDITNLTFSNLDWEKNSITFFQKKTSRMVKLPLLPAVGDALIDYLKYGRPQTDSSYVFVKHKAPFEKPCLFIASCLYVSATQVSAWEKRQPRAAYTPPHTGE